MNVGDTIEIRGRGTSFLGWRGLITATSPAFMVLLEGETKPMFFGRESLLLVSTDDQRPMTAGE